MNNNEVEISVIMATYHPSWEKCVFTLDSIIGQKNVSLELIITDDGSKDNLFGEIEEYLKSKMFNSYKLVSHEKNQGTVINCFDGLKMASGKYVKLISPGDALFNETILENWLLFLKNSGRSWSFSDAIYYNTENDKVQISKTPLAPRIIDCYLSHNDLVSRWNYVVLEDLALGAALLCERNTFFEYLKKLVNIVVYAEDLSFMLMMYDGIVPAYYPNTTVIYEFGCGVSTTGNKKWRDRFNHDLRNAEKLVVDKENKDVFQIKMSKALTTINSGGNKKKRIMKNLQKGGIKKVMKFRLNPRLSTNDCSSCGPWWNSFSETK